MNREYHKWWSPHLGRDMELLVFGSSGTRMLVFPTRQQRFFEYEDRGMVHSLRKKIEAGELQLFCVDGIDEESLYCFGKSPEERLARQLEYERYIIKEVLPFAEEKNGGSLLCAHGSSLGAYQAVAITLRNPKFFQRVLAFSGRYDLTTPTGDFLSLFEGYQGGELEAWMPNLAVPRITSPALLKRLRKIRFTLVVGDEDPFCENTVALAAVLKERKIPCDIHLWCGNAHRFRYWRQMVRVYL